MLIDTLSDARKWNQPLTINLDVNGRKVKSISQKKIRIHFEMDKSKVVFNAVPGKDEIIIRF